MNQCSAAFEMFCQSLDELCSSCLKRSRESINRSLRLKCQSIRYRTRSLHDVLQQQLGRCGRNNVIIDLRQIV